MSFSCHPSIIPEIGNQPESKEGEKGGENHNRARGWEWDEMRLAECDARLLQTCRLGRRSLSLGSFGHLQRHPIGMRTSQTRLYVLLIPPSFCYSSAIFPDFLISFLESPDLLVAFTEIPYLFTQRLYYS